MFYCFVPPSDVSDGTIRITGPNARHLRLVLRCQNGESVRVRSDRFLYETRILRIVNDAVEVEILSRSEAVPVSGPKIILATGLIQEKRFDLLLQTACQMGVFAIRPLLTDYTADHRVKSGRMERWTKIIEEACMQSQNPYPPGILPVESLRDAVRKEKETDPSALLLMPSELEEKERLTPSLLEGVDRIVLFIGPEGGWSPDEAAFADAEGIRTVTLGRRILRTETAAAVALTLIQERTGQL